MLLWLREEFIYRQCAFPPTCKLVQLSGTKNNEYEGLTVEALMEQHDNTEYLHHQG